MDSPQAKKNHDYFNKNHKNTRNLLKSVGALAYQNTSIFGKQERLNCIQFHNFDDKSTR